jgi:hypothetical protein|tara:strand:- start:231 stop:431 length:201 start_codon:yes stop_codon:yes gene_type:complete
LISAGVDEVPYGLIVLMATIRDIAVSCPLYTRPMAPCPNVSMILYLPTFEIFIKIIIQKASALKKL